MVLARFAIYAALGVLFNLAAAAALPTGGPDDNNEIATADAVVIDPPNPCTSGLVTVNGFVGDNGQSITPPPLRLFDCDDNGAVDFADFACFQQCFGSEVSTACSIHDQDRNGLIDLEDFLVLLYCIDDPDNPACIQDLPPVVDPLQDVDIFRIDNLSPGQVVSALVEGETTIDATPRWDPYLRVFADAGSGVEELAGCDDYHRFSFDAFTTVEVPAGVDTIYIGVSSEVNANYDHEDPTSIAPLSQDDAGAYALSLAVTDPGCAEDDHSAGAFTCYVSRHEPDDTLADATAIGPITSTIIVGAIGDGAFSPLGQDIDIYRLELDGDPLAQTAGVMSITATVKGLFGGGFQTTLDLAMALYTSDGELIAAADQSAELGGLDQTRPKLGANVCGSDVVDCQTNPSPEPGLYYLAIFGTDRVAFDENGDPLPMAIPPSVLNFPHGENTGCTNACDLRPTLGGRVNRPGPPLEGRDPPEPNTPPNSATLQCYRIVISTCPNGFPFCQGSPLLQATPTDIDEVVDPDGSDSIPNASTSIIPGDRLANAPVSLRVLGNGPFGGLSGDVDFYAIPTDPGQLISLNIADAQQPPGNTSNNVRSYLALYGEDGCPFAFEDYSLERHDDDIFNADRISDEIAATVVAKVPQSDTLFTYPLVAIDAGNLDPEENTPFDALTPGTALSRRFQTGLFPPRLYNIAVTVIDPVVPLNDGRRMFAAVHRGIDDMHTEPFLANPIDGNRDRYPPILELDPWTGETRAVLSGGPFFQTWRVPTGICSDPHGCSEHVSANPVVAYDGETLFLSVERCVSGAGQCQTVSHPLFWVDPDLTPGDPDFIVFAGLIEGLPFGAALTGMTEIDGTLFALDTEANAMRYWAKDAAPTVDNGGASGDLTAFGGDAFDDVDGDVGTDGNFLYVGCSLAGASVGLCVFDDAFAFVGIVPDPLTNDALIPGPRLGGLDSIADGVMVTSDRNGPVVQHWDVVADHVSAFELPREFVVDRLTIR